MIEHKCNFRFSNQLHSQYYHSSLLLTSREGGFRKKIGVTHLSKACKQDLRSRAHTQSCIHTPIWRSLMFSFLRKQHDSETSVELQASQSSDQKFNSLTTTSACVRVLTGISELHEYEPHKMQANTLQWTSIPSRGKSYCVAPMWSQLHGWLWCFVLPSQVLDVDVVQSELDYPDSLGLE